MRSAVSVDMPQMWVPRRDGALNRAVAIVRDLARRPRPSADSLRLVHDLAAIGRTPLRVSAGAATPQELGAALVSIDGALSRVGNVLEESVAQLERGRRADAAARLVTVEQLLRVAHERGADGSRVARAYLTARQGALQAAAGEVRGDAILWLGLGALLVPLLVLVVRRRVWRPLHELEAGLAQVADGDLTVSVPVRRSDELGRLAEHFNAMTRVLRDRAEEQGRFAAAGELLAAALPRRRGAAITRGAVVATRRPTATAPRGGGPPPRHLSVDTWVRDGQVSVAVGDNGRGVAPDIAPRLFRPFATTKGRRGTGLGLYISRQIAREAGGDLTLTSPPGFGARFVLSLPLALAQASPPDSPPSLAPPPAPPPHPSTPPSESPLRSAGGAQASAGSLAGLRVLIVEDEEAVRRPMARYLTRRGAEVDEAADGVEGLARLRTQPANVILADLRMPRMGGGELYAQLEEERPELAARVLFLSGDVSQLAQPGNTPVPRERVLVKPVELAERELRVLRCRL